MRRVAPLVAACALLAPATAQAGGPHQVRIDLRATIVDQRTRMEITGTRTARSVAMPADVLFALDSARLSSTGLRAVARVLRTAVPSLRLRVRGAGEAKPVASNRRRARNRRVEITVRR